MGGAPQPIRLHAETHLPTGQDPIPFGAWAALYSPYGDEVTVPGNIIGGENIALPKYATSDSKGSIFSGADGGSTIQLLQPGAYTIEAALKWSDPATSQGVLTVTDISPPYGGQVFAPASAITNFDHQAMRVTEVWTFQETDIPAGTFYAALNMDLTATTDKIAIAAFIRVIFTPCYALI